MFFVYLAWHSLGHVGSIAMHVKSTRDRCMSRYARHLDKICFQKRSGDWWVTGRTGSNRGEAKTWLSQTCSVELNQWRLRWIFDLSSFILWTPWVPYRWIGLVQGGWGAPSVTKPPIENQLRQLRVKGEGPVGGIRPTLGSKKTSVVPLTMVLIYVFI